MTCAPASSIMALLAQEMMSLFVSSNGTPNAGGEPRPEAEAKRKL
jgi:hypothetical protein